MVQKMFNITIIVACLFLIGTYVADCRPSANSDLDITNIDINGGEYNGDLSPETIRKVQQCDRDTETMELCMRCAKVTKSEIVYPLCCANEDNVKDWCNEYVFFAKDDVIF